MTEYRIPRGKAVRHKSYHEVMEGERPTLKYLKASPYLPVAEIEPTHDDPIVLPAGTWVGITSTTGTAMVTGTVTSGAITGTAHTYSLDSDLGYYALVPAASRPYTLTYTANDINSTWYTPGTLNLDSLGTVVAAAGTSTATVGINAVTATGYGVKPIGVVYQDIYASWLSSNYTNYDRQPNISFLTSNKVIQIPAVTTAEQAIEPGDVVAVDGIGATASWNPVALAANTGVVANSPGRLKRWSEICAAAGITAAELGKAQENIVGRCLRKFLIAYKSGVTAGYKLSYALTAGSITSSAAVHTESRHAARVQTVPGLSLPGSGSLGVAGHLLGAKADANGAFWALEILVGTY
jgi:hypothetical protein